MNREEVIEVLTNALDGLGTAWIVDEAISAAIKLLAADTNVARKDPITGLVPCGCGGKAKYIEEYDKFYTVRVECPQCYVATCATCDEEHATHDWNRAMGYTAPPRPGAIVPETDEMDPNGEEGAES